MVQRTIAFHVSVSAENDTWLKTRLTYKLRHSNIDRLSDCPRLFFFVQTDYSELDSY